MATKEGWGVKGPAGVVGVKELREDASAIIAAVENGGWFIVSKRRNLVGVLLPSDMATDLMREHAAEVVSLQVSKRREPLAR